ncbi:MAG: hypothetical protein IJJ26_00270 [Victivallales bacterium]|nr:hypothetical protein [Victivallales bacterium]
MKTVFISDEQPIYKANLHCHSTFSDGRRTPAQLKELYQAEGYSIVAYTDHEVLVDHPELNDENFLAMLGIEVGANRQDDPRSWRTNATFHINFFPRKSGQDTMPCFNPKKVKFGKMFEELRQSQKYIGTPDYQATYSNIQDLIDRYYNEGFLVQINHPTWSVQTTADYTGLKHVFAMELYNHGCWVEGWEEDNSHVWDDLLRQGMHIFGTACDDNHNGHPQDSRHWDSFGGFTMIQAKALTQEAVTEALEYGNFYASTGPLFHNITLEDNTLKVHCSPVDKIYITGQYRSAKVAYPEPGQNTLSEATFDLSGFFPGYARVTIVDQFGKQAWSQPFYNFPGNGNY